MTTVKLAYDNVFESIEPNAKRAATLAAISDALIALHTSLTDAGVPKAEVDRAVKSVQLIAFAAV